MNGRTFTLGMAAVLLVIIAVGAVAGAPSADDRTDAGAPATQSATSPAVAGPATANHSAIEGIGSPALDASWQNFTEANQSLANASADLDAVSARVAEKGAYSDSDHDEANASLDQMENEMAALNRAANESVQAVNDSDATPARKFQALRAIEAHRSAAEQRANASVEDYQREMSDRMATSEPTVTVRFGGGLLGGVVIGILAGAIIPFREAKNVEEQLKLSRDVTYNRRTALIPIAIGVVLLVCGLGLLQLLGGIRLIGVII